MMESVSAPAPLTSPPPVTATATVAVKFAVVAAASKRFLGLPTLLSLLQLLVLQIAVASAVPVSPAHWGVVSSLMDRWAHANLNGTATQDCSTLEWLTCNSDGNVIGLRITNLDLSDTLPDEIGTLETLQSLVLVGTNLYGPIPSWIGSLPALQFLVLGSNDFNGSIPNTLGANQPLSELDLSLNSLSGQIPESIYQAVTLRSLSLSNNGLTGGISRSIGNLVNASNIFMEDNFLNGSVPEEIGNLIELTDLDLGNNKLTGTIPETLKNCQKLNAIDFNFNQMEGSIPDALFALPQLERIRLGNNKFNGAFPSNFPSSSALKILDLYDNDISGPLPSSIDRLTNLFFLDLSNNNISGSFPDTITNLKNMANLLLKSNSISGSLPRNIGNMTRLFILDVRFLGLNGTIPPGIVNCTNLRVLDMEGNLFTGTLPPGFDNLKELERLNLANNSLSGPIPDLLNNMTGLSKLDLSNNLFDGELPSNLTSELILLNLSKNNLSGRLKPVVAPGNATQYLLLSDNKLSGDLSDLQVATWPNLVLLALGNNSISSASSSSSLPSNISIVLAGNPVCERLSNFSSLSLRGGCSEKMFSTSYKATPVCEAPGCEPPYQESPRVYNSANKQCFCAKPYNGTFLFFSPVFVVVENRTVKNFESSMAQFLNLYVDQVRVDSMIENFDKTWSVGVLLFPNFTSPWPPSDEDNITSVFSNPETSFVRLFGGYSFRTENFVPAALPPAPPSPLLSPPPPPLPSAKSIGVWLPIVVSVGVLFCIGIAICFIFVIIRRRKAAENNQKPSVSNRIPLSEILEATNNFSEDNFIGEGGFGVVFRGKSGSGEDWAVKRAKRTSARALETFRREVEALSKMSHQNLLQLIGFCDDDNERILVYELAPHGSLQRHLSKRTDDTEPLSFKQRVEIAVGAAHALHYLHSFAKPAIVHRDIKSDNILIDANMEAKVADFGLLKDIPNPTGNESEALPTHVAGTPGYLDPEYFANFKVTTKSDVYSFGVVMMELLSGKPPILTVKGGEMSLVEWMEPQILARRLDSFMDSSMGQYPKEQAIVFADLARLCTLPLGKLRPNMEIVAWKLLEIRNLILKSEQ